MKVVMNNAEMVPAPKKGTRLLLLWTHSQW